MHKCLWLKVHWASTQISIATWARQFKWISRFKRQTGPWTPSSRSSSIVRDSWKRDINLPWVSTQVHNIRDLLWTKAYEQMRTKLSLESCQNEGWSTSNLYSQSMLLKTFICRKTWTRSPISINTALDIDFSPLRGIPWRIQPRFSSKREKWK